MLVFRYFPPRGSVKIRVRIRTPRRGSDGATPSRGEGRGYLWGIFGKRLSPGEFSLVGLSPRIQMTHGASVASRMHGTLQMRLLVLIIRYDAINFTLL